MRTQKQIHPIRLGHQAAASPEGELRRAGGLLYFDLGEGKDYLYHGQNRFVGVHCHDELRVSDKQRAAIAPKMPSEVFPEYILIRVNDFNTVAKTPLEEWVNYLKNGVIDEHTTAPGLREARKKLQYYAMPEKEQAAYRAHLLDQMVQNDEIDSAKEEGRIEGRAEGLAEGIEQGMAKGMEKGIAQGVERGQLGERFKNAAGMKAAGIPAATIATITGLSAEEIEAITPRSNVSLRGDVRLRPFPS